MLAYKQTNKKKTTPTMLLHTVARYYKPQAISFLCARDMVSKRVYILPWCTLRVTVLFFFIFTRALTRCQLVKFVTNKDGVFRAIRVEEKK